MKFLIAMTISLVFIGCSSMKKDQKYGDTNPKTEFTFPITAPAKSSPPAMNICIPQNFAIYKSLLKNDTISRKHKIMFLIQATKIVEFSLDNYIDFESKKYDEKVFIQKDEMLTYQLNEIMGFVRTEERYNDEFDRYSRNLNSSCDVSYCKKDLPNLKKINNALNLAIKSQEKVLGLKIELLNGLYSYKVRKTLTIDQFAQLQNGIISTFQKTKIQEKSVERNEAALSLFNNKFDELCTE